MNHDKRTSLSYENFRDSHHWESDLYTVRSNFTLLIANNLAIESVKSISKFKIHTISLPFFFVLLLLTVLWQRLMQFINI